MMDKTDVHTKHEIKPDKHEHITIKIPTQKHPKGAQVRYAKDGEIYTITKATYCPFITFENGKYYIQFDEWSYNLTFVTNPISAWESELDIVSGGRAE